MAATQRPTSASANALSLSSSSLLSSSNLSANIPRSIGCWHRSQTQPSPPVSPRSASAGPKASPAHSPSPFPPATPPRPDATAGRSPPSASRQPPTETSAASGTRTPTAANSSKRRLASATRPCAEPAAARALAREALRPSLRLVAASTAARSSETLAAWPSASPPAVDAALGSGLWGCGAALVAHTQARSAAVATEAIRLDAIESVSPACMAGPMAASKALSAALMESSSVARLSSSQARLREVRSRMCFELPSPLSGSHARAPAHTTRKVPPLAPATGAPGEQAALEPLRPLMLSVTSASLPPALFPLRSSGSAPPCSEALSLPSARTRARRPPFWQILWQPPRHRAAPPGRARRCGGIRPRTMDAF